MTCRPDLIHIPIKLHKDILNCYWIRERTRMFGKMNQKDITWKIRMGEQSFLCMTHCPDLIHIPIKLHEDIPNGYWVMAHTRMFGKYSSKGHNLETKKGKTMIHVRDTLSWPNTYSYIFAWRYSERLPSYGAYKNVDGRMDRRIAPCYNTSVFSKWTYENQEEMSISSAY